MTGYGGGTYGGGVYGGAGTPILRSTPGSNTQIAVEIAWGGAPNAAESSLTWTDITSDVLHANKVTITVGRQDESQTPNPATCAFTVDNRAGKYSRAPQSSNYPNVKHGTPIRVRVINGGVSRTRFFGNAVGFTPTWDDSAKYAVVNVTAAGVKRRIKQQKSALKSALTRAIPSLTALVSYWPCEDGSKSAALLSGIGTQQLNINGTSQLSSYSGFLGTLSIPTFQAGESWSGSIPAYAASTSGQFRFLLSIPAGTTIPDQTVMAEMSTGGTIAKVKLFFCTNAGTGGMRLAAYDRGGTSLVDTGTVTFAITGNPSQVSVSWTQTGGNITFQMSQLPANIPGTTAYYFNSTATAQTITAANNITMNPAGAMTGASIGQITFQSTTDDIFTLASQINAYIGEFADQRMGRLCAEQGENFAYFGAFPDIPLGPQGAVDFMSNMEDAALADGGILFDGTANAAGTGSGGLLYMPRSTMQSNAVFMALTGAQLAHKITPIDDDQAIVNSFTASRVNGGAVTYQDTTSNLSVANIGLYDASATVNVEFDAALRDFASWKVALGTVDDYRYPTVNLGLHNNYSLVASWQTALPGYPITIDSINAVASQQDAAQLRMMLEGWTETIDQYTWDVVLNCSPGYIWTTGTLAATTGDSSATLIRLDTDGCSISARPTTTTLTVVSTTSLWTTASDDLPFDVNIQGVKYTVTGVANVSGLTQTLTLSSTIPSTVVGAAVTLWRPYVPAR